MSLNTFVAHQFRKPTGFWGKLAVRAMMKGNRGAIAWAIEASEIKSEDTVLEIGFGHGISFEMIAALTTQKVYGLDFSEDMVRMAAERNTKLMSQDRLELRCGEVANSAFESDFFDKIIAVNVIYFWKQPQKELAEIKRILKPGGRAVLYLTDKSAMEKLSFTSTHVFTTYTGEEFAKEVKAAGFAKVHIDTKLLKRKSLRVCHCIIAEKEP
ncbi:MAG TPA: class I SAM-dependent methyltransferase [Bacteroidota bacterium]|nr:class I SAM-dependent methyltransferase [Bacteroidota bacterium]